jgi:hypothetical protein
MSSFAGVARSYGCGGVGAGHAREKTMEQALEYMTA